MKVAVLGDGGWGTTLAILLAANKHTVKVWGAFPEYIEKLNKTRINTRYLPGIAIPASVKFSSDLCEVVADAQIVVLAVPSQHMRSVVKQIACFVSEINLNKKIFVSVSKGIEISSGLRISQVVEEVLPRITCAVLSGPTIAHEVAYRMPSVAVVASSNENDRKQLQTIFMCETFRIYTNDDCIGVELGGSLKNVIAIACGISDGLGFGSNAKAALLSRGLAEISRLGVALGAKQETFSGISGLGDLVTTCVSTHSRNRFVGEQIGKGKTLAQIQKKMKMVAEGVPTAKAAYELSERHGIEMPITREIYRVLYKSKSAKHAVSDLMNRQKKAE